MGFREVVRDPPHVTYVMNGMANEPAVGLNADHAYWISGLTLRSPGVNPPIGTIDVFSHGFGAAIRPRRRRISRPGRTSARRAKKPWELQ